MSLLREKVGEKLRVWTGNYAGGLGCESVALLDARGYPLDRLGAIMSSRLNAAPGHAFVRIRAASAPA
jgi:hypothetical protein